ncbi:MAG: LysM peptidoglycan-binding domain-containing protein [Chitinophagaceae bacterium]|nr:LysM peptidoglycan-binding domain-containing protein [Chitinophagaceae bacterium]
MKKLVTQLLSFGIVFALHAQSDLTVHSENGKLYLHHIVAAKENFYSIGRLYNISPKEIAPFNGITLTTGLEIGQDLKIPLQSGNFAQHGIAASDEVFVPLYHMVAQSEGLYRIGQNYNKLSVGTLKTWNNLNSESISNGQMLVIGFLKVKTHLSDLAAYGTKRIGGAVTQTPPPVVSHPAVQAEASPVVAVAAEQPPAKTTSVVVNTGQDNKTDGAGFFKDSYREQSASYNAFKSEMGAGAVFKSTSGWQDAKYYALMNNITPGTIVRITNTNNNRTIFAKVLGELPPGKENEGLLIRISNSGAAELRINDRDPQFSAQVAYARDVR